MKKSLHFKEYKFKWSMGKNNKIRKCFELFESKYASQNLRNALKELFKWKCLSLNAYIRKIKLYLKFNFLYYEARNHLIQTDIL